MTICDLVHDGVCIYYSLGVLLLLNINLMDVNKRKNRSCLFSFSSEYIGINYRVTGSARDK